MLCLLACETLFWACFDLGARLGQFLQPVFAPRKLLRDRDAVWNIGLICSFCFGHQFGDLGLLRDNQGENRVASRKDVPRR